MSTIAQLVSRTYRQYLSPPSAAVPQTYLSGTFAIGQNQFTYADLLMPEETAKIGPGTRIEMDSEMMRVTAINTTTRAVDVTRSTDGTTEASHPPNTVIYISPHFTRKAVVDALSDAVVNLFPDLYGVQTILVDGSGGLVDLEDTTATSIIEANALGVNNSWFPVQVTMLANFPEVEIGPAVRVDDPVSYGDLYITYAHSFPRPTGESVELANLGVEPHWEKIVMVDAVAGLLPGVDLEKSTARYLTELLAAQGVPVGELSDLSISMLRYRALLMDEAKRALLRRFQPQVSMRKPGAWSMGRMT